MRGRLLPSYMALAPLQIAALARRQRLRVIHDPFGISPFLVPRAVAPFARIVTIHDMIPFIYPDTHARLTNLLFRRYIPQSLRFIDAVVTVSEASRHDITRFFGVPPERICVIHNGVSPKFTPVSPTEISDTCRRYELPQPYLLTVGAVQARKNLGTLFAAYKILRERGISHTLVVVGKKAWKTEGTFLQLRELGLEQEVIFTGHVADEDLPAIYSGASAFAFPSLYEGFGLPPLEAAACGTPAVTSKTSSMPEVVGDFSVLVEPYDIQGFAEALERLLLDDEYHAEYRGRGLRGASNFTWERAARLHLSLYQSFSRPPS
jgi:glycosyltransferase involved in cell wall biosynthesis